MSFIYGEHLGDREVRLLEVVEGHGEDPLHVKLSGYRLDAVEFEALSYVWGDAKVKLEIHCNGRPFGITENLHAVLLESRRRGITSLLWVDALCINQADTEERTRQVRMMTEIYSKAQRVIVWLGNNVWHDDQGVELAERIFSLCDGAAFDIDNVSLGVRVEDLDYEGKELQRPYNPRSPFWNLGWQSLFDMMGLAWFTRVWVIQELLVAKRSVMWRGKYHFDPEAILFSAVLVNPKRDLWASYIWYTDIGNCVAFNVAKLYFQYKKRGAQPYWDTLCQCGLLQASDLRDKYFAPIGISSGLQYGLVDYSKSLGEVHAQVGYICLSGLAERGMPSSGLDLLAHGHYRDHLSLEYGMASWVPGLISADGFNRTIAEAYPTAALCCTKKGYTAVTPGIEFRFLIETEEIQAMQTIAYPAPLVNLVSNDFSLLALATHYTHS
jgi:hypothetical protein